MTDYFDNEDACQPMPQAAEDDRIQAMKRYVELDRLVLETEHEQRIADEKLLSLRAKREKARQQIASYVEPKEVQAKATPWD